MSVKYSTLLTVNIAMVFAGRGFNLRDPTHETQFHEWPTTRVTALRSGDRFAIEGIDEKEGEGREGGREKGGKRK